MAFKLIDQMSNVETFVGGHFIDNEWRLAQQQTSFHVLNPATAHTMGLVPIASQQDIQDALQSADKALQTWRRTNAWDRSRFLRNVAETLRSWAPEAARIMSLEQGKPLREATAEWHAAADQFDWFADEARRIYGRTLDAQNSATRISVHREPIGVVAAFTPWNFPASLPARKIAPALAAGCTIILKPAEEAPFSAFIIAQACLEAGIPPGVVSMLTGNPAEISETLIKSKIIKKISLTGSTAVGRHILSLAAENVIPVSLELGGHAPVIVCADVNVEVAASKSVQAKFRNAGQVCVSPTRFIVHESVADDFETAMHAAISKLTVGNGLDSNTDIGPLINDNRRDSVQDLIDDAVDRGAKVLKGDHAPSENAAGYFFPPTLLTRVAPESRIMREEPFGPVAPMTTFKTLDDAIRLANDSEFGLAAYIFSNDIRTITLLSDNLEVGMVGVNHFMISTAESPFGGIKQSGFGREGGAEGIDSYTQTKSVSIEFDQNQ